MSRTPKTNHVYCPHCNSNNEPYFSRSVPMGFYCPDCGEDVDDDQTMSDTPNTREDLAAVTEQRDRLAEAIKAATVLIAAKGRHNTMLAYQGLREALDAVEGEDS
jgi:DNA-directed RNA polymerase subunit RPC12/RpoP